MSDTSILPKVLGIVKYSCDRSMNIGYSQFNPNLYAGKPKHPLRNLNNLNENKPELQKKQQKTMAHHLLKDHHNKQSKAKSGNRSKHRYTRNP